MQKKQFPIMLSVCHDCGFSHKYATGSTSVEHA